MSRSRIMSFGEKDTLSGPILDYLKSAHGIDPDDVMGFSLNCKANRLQTITVELLMRSTEAPSELRKFAPDLADRLNGHPKEPASVMSALTDPPKPLRDVSLRSEPTDEEAADIGRRIRAVGERTRLVPVIGQTRTELPVRQPGEALEDQTASCAYVVGFEDAPDGSMRRHPVTCGETIAYHEDNEGAGWWYHIAHQPVPHHQATSYARSDDER
jgi:hypothetical protein